MLTFAAYITFCMYIKPKKTNYSPPLVKVGDFSYLCSINPRIGTKDL